MSEHDSTCARIALSNATGVHFPASPRVSVGQEFGCWRIIGESFYAKTDRSRREFVVAKCKCGTVAAHRADMLVKGSTSSCGCVQNARLSERRLVHGFSHREDGTQHPLYSLWLNIRNRCGNPKNIGWRYYGGRGIRVCPEWQESSSVFIEWALANGWCEGLQIDRIDVNGNYEPGNCRFVTPLTNQRNRRPFVYPGKKITEAQASHIVELLRRGFPGRRIAEWFRISESAVSSIKRGKNWKRFKK